MYFMEDVLTWLDIEIFTNYRHVWIMMKKIWSTNSCDHLCVWECLAIKTIEMNIFLCACMMCANCWHHQDNFLNKTTYFSILSINSFWYFASRILSLKSVCHTKNLRNSVCQKHFIKEIHFFFVKEIEFSDFQIIFAYWLFVYILERNTWIKKGGSLCLFPKY